ncbi:recombinase family protein [Enterococcus sp. UD-01]|jgi:DNA invertase Pin-like site-specific DNA recombinase|uniref:recombinase family protein n=1 Tax=Enterococcus sp. UD-01 TaxID=3373911 RepID=UPI003837C962
MNLGYAHGNRLNQQLDFLESYGVNEIFSDQAQNYGALKKPKSAFQAMLDYSESSDCIVIAFLEAISRDYRELLEFFSELYELELELIVLTAPELSLMEWWDIISWVEQNDRLQHPRLIQLKKEKERNKTSYSVFSRDVEAKKLYRGIIRQLFQKQKLRRIAQQNGVPVETVYRIQQEMKRIKTAGILALCFFLAIATIKIAENFTDNVLVQVSVCVVATLVILYNTLVDSE